tara:strand:- start:17 stop:331 length:315 start_codon:yes stop_codon:yes gene_type:complete
VWWWHKPLLNLCVELTRWAAPVGGMTYQEINIWLFVIIQPGLIVLLLFIQQSPNLLHWQVSLKLFGKVRIYILNFAHEVLCIPQSDVKEIAPRIFLNGTFETTP